MPGKGQVCWRCPSTSGIALAWPDVVVLRLRDGLIGNQIDAVCGGDAVIVLDSGNISGIHFTAKSSPGAWLRVIAGLFIVVARFIEVLIQFLLCVAPALANSSHLLRGRCSLPALLRGRAPRVGIGIVAHISMVPPDIRTRKTATGLRRNGRAGV